MCKIIDLDIKSRYKSPLWYRIFKCPQKKNYSKTQAISQNSRWPPSAIFEAIFKTCPTNGPTLFVVETIMIHTF